MPDDDGARASLVESILAHEREQSERERIEIEEYRQTDSAWRKVFANPEWNTLNGRMQSMVAKQPANTVLSDRQTKEILGLDDRMRQIEHSFGAGRRMPWERADTPEHYRQWLARCAYPFISTTAQGCHKAHLDDAYGRAVQLAQTFGLSTPPRLTDPTTLVAEQEYLLRLRDWSKQKEDAKRRDGPQADGPTPPKMFIWNGKSVELSPKPHALLSMLWSVANRKATVGDVESKVWGEESETDGRLKSAITRVNSALLESTCPLQVRKSGKWLTLT